MCNGQRVWMFSSLPLTLRSFQASNPPGMAPGIPSRSLSLSLSPHLTPPQFPWKKQRFNPCSTWSTYGWFPQSSKKRLGLNEVFEGSSGFSWVGYSRLNGLMGFKMVGYRYYPSSPRQRHRSRLIAQPVKELLRRIGGVQLHVASGEGGRRQNDLCGSQGIPPMYGIYIYIP